MTQMIPALVLLPVQVEKSVSIACLTESTQIGKQSVKIQVAARNKEKGLQVDIQPRIRRIVIRFMYTKICLLHVHLQHLFFIHLVMKSLTTQMTQAYCMNSLAAVQMILKYRKSTLKHPATPWKISSSSLKQSCLSC